LAAEANFSLANLCGVFSHIVINSNMGTTFEGIRAAFSGLDSEQFHVRVKSLTSNGDKLAEKWVLPRHRPSYKMGI
jgi:hypothetical protein